MKVSNILQKVIYQTKNKAKENKTDGGQGWMVKGAICRVCTALEQTIRQSLLLAAGTLLIGQCMGPLGLGIWVSSLVISLVFTVQMISEKKKKQIHMFVLKIKSYAYEKNYVQSICISATKRAQSIRLCSAETYTRIHFTTHNLKQRKASMFFPEKLRLHLESQLLPGKDPSLFWDGLMTSFSDPSRPVLHRHCGG